MRSPFPGMDPFIEALGRWEDFHNKLMGDMERYLSRALPDRYVVRLGERSYIDDGNYLCKPDIGIKTAQAAQAATSPASVLEESALDMEGRVEEEVRELYLEIYELDPQLRLVTGIEVLSPINKRPGSVGWYQYERKRRAFFEGHANLVEIDLIRSGQRHPMAEPWPSSPYVLLVLRKERAPRCKVWPAHYREKLPTLPIPLAPPDADASLDLQALLDDIYDRSRYGQNTDYTRPIRPPLSDEDMTWLKGQLRA